MRTSNPLKRILAQSDVATMVAYNMTTVHAGILIELNRKA